ncbi:flagellar assembly protein T N-terminal domain-containing protein [Chromobacterium subtsugae]|uniref:flagellar assembly protein T N-terminal domain-containing protein n=1 Tax=Chromobacterium subtsugae TaxID=251747 RepID=UPI00064181F2|nr:flagellar assembly protein T N-terminal domain-containing protein [Chromobacterium subtsugae]
MKRNGLAIAALVAAFLLSGPARAEMFSAEGVAPLDNGLVAARDMALRDALKLIAIRQGARVESAQVLENGRASESGTLTASGAVQGTVKVVSEYQQGKLYHVKVQVDTGDPAAAAPRPRDPSCAMPPGRSLRRKLVTTYFGVERPAEASDMPDLATALPTELSRRLARNSMLTVRDANTVSVLADSRIAEPAAGWDIARQLGQREDVQFVVAGRVLSTSVTGKGARPSFFESNNTSQQGSFYNGPFAGMFGMGVKYVPTQRQFDAEVWIYDGLTGSLLANERVSGLAKGQVVPPSPQPFASAAFWQGDYGRLVDKLMDRAAQRVNDIISCIPFSARIVRQEGKRVYINAGLLDGMAVGDKLLLYRRVPGQPVRDLISGRELGMPETLNGDVSLVQVQPNFSIGIAQSNSQPVSEGDYVRFVPGR